MLLTPTTSLPQCSGQNIKSLRVELAGLMHVVEEAVDDVM